MEEGVRDTPNKNWLDSVAAVPPKLTEATICKTRRRLIILPFGFAIMNHDTAQGISNKS